MDKEKSINTRYNVVFCIEQYSENGGATFALREYIECNSKLNKVVVLTNNIALTGQHDFEVFDINQTDLNILFSKSKFDYIHFYHANGYSVLKKLLTFIKKNGINLSVLTTVCQKPSYPGYWLSPFEIRNSNLLVYIDYTASKDKMYTFVNKDKKQVIYIGCSNSLIEITDEINKCYKPNQKSNKICYGRGSYLLKCPKNMFVVFDEIPSPKEFVIVGSGPEEYKEWIYDEIARRNSFDIQYKEGTSFSDWLKIAKSFDVFLYHLPENAWSSVDGTLVQAMLLEKPVIYCGPSAPKEILKHMYNALVADKESEIPDLCKLLKRDINLREKLSQNARNTILTDFRMTYSCEKYNKIAEDFKNGRYDDKIHVPLWFIIKYYGIKYTYRINSIIRRFF